MMNCKNFIEISINRVVGIILAVSPIQLAIFLFIFLILRVSVRNLNFI